MNLTYHNRQRFTLYLIYVISNHTIDQYSTSYPEKKVNLRLTSSRTWRNIKLRKSKKNERTSISSNEKIIQSQSGSQKEISRIFRRLSKTERRTIEIKIIIRLIRELSERLEKLVTITEKYHITKNIARISETLNNGWTTLKNLQEEKKGGGLTRTTPQNNHGSYGHDLYSDWERKVAQKGKDESSEGYNSTDIIGAGRVLALKGGMITTREECADLQEAWEARRQPE